MISTNISFGYQIAEAAGVQFNPACDRIIARVEDGRLLGGVIYTNFTGASIAMHVGSWDPTWCNTLYFVWAVFDYPFNKLGCNVIFGQVPESNSKALDFDIKVGFKVIGYVPDVFYDGGVHIIAMYRDECRWLKYNSRFKNKGAR